jgi:thiol-disulfide isomerase/thioredoxin
MVIKKGCGKPGLSFFLIAKHKIYSPMHYIQIFLILTFSFFDFHAENINDKIIYSNNGMIRADLNNSTLLAVGTIAPEWELQNSENKKRKLSDFKGKIVVMDFWATWCAPCIQSQPKLQAIHEKYKDVVVLGMDFNDKPNVELNKYKLRKNLSYEMILNAEKIGAFYKVVGLPTVYVIDKAGKIIYASLGYSEKEEHQLEKIIEQAK